MRVIIRRIFFVVFISSLIASGGVCFSSEEGFPKIGFVKNNGANVRAGDNINFERLCKLEKGDPVKIVGRRYSWFKIKLPKTAHLYIKSDYVDLDPKNRVGVVNAMRVNLRAGPDTKYSILGQVSEPEELDVLTEENGWSKIIPPRGTTGWMHSTQITFSPEIIEDTMKIKKEWVKPVKRPGENKTLKIKFSRETPKPKGNLTFSIENNQ